MTRICLPLLIAICIGIGAHLCHGQGTSPADRIVLNHLRGEAVDPSLITDENYALVAKLKLEDGTPLSIISQASETTAWQSFLKYQLLRAHLRDKENELLALGINRDMRNELENRVAAANSLLPNVANILVYAQRDSASRLVRANQVPAALKLIRSREANTAQDELVRSMLHTADLDTAFARKAMDWTIRIDPEHVPSRQARSLTDLIYGQFLKSQDEAAITLNFCEQPSDVFNVQRIQLMAKTAAASTETIAECTADLLLQVAAQAQHLRGNQTLAQATTLLELTEVCLRHDMAPQARYLLNQLSALDLEDIDALPLSSEGALARETDMVLRLSQRLEDRTGGEAYIADVFRDALNGSPRLRALYPYLIRLRLAENLLQINDELNAEKQLRTLLNPSAIQRALPDLHILTLTHLAGIHAQRRDFGEATEHYNDAMTRCRTLVRQDAYFRPVLVDILYEFAGTLMESPSAKQSPESLLKEATLIATTLSREDAVQHQPALAKVVWRLATYYKQTGDKTQQRRYAEIAQRLYADLYQLSKSEFRTPYLDVLETNATFYKEQHLYDPWRNTVEIESTLHPLQPDDPEALLDGLLLLLELATCYYEHWDIESFKLTIAEAQIFCEEFSHHQPLYARYLSGYMAERLATISLLTSDARAAYTHLDATTQSLTPLLETDLATLFHKSEGESISTDEILAKLLRGHYLKSLLTAFDNRLLQSRPHLEQTIALAKQLYGDQHTGFEIEYFALTCLMEMLKHAEGAPPISPDEILSLKELAAQASIAHPSQADWLQHWSINVIKISSTKHRKQNIQHAYSASQQLVSGLLPRYGIRYYWREVEQKQRLARQALDRGESDLGFEMIAHLVRLSKKLPPELQPEIALLNNTVLDDLEKLYQHPTHTQAAKSLAQTISQLTGKEPQYTGPEFRSIIALAHRALAQWEKEAGHLDIAIEQLEVGREKILELRTQERTSAQIALCLIHFDYGNYLSKMKGTKLEEVSSTFAKSVVAYEDWEKKYPELSIPGEVAPFLKIARFFYYVRDYESSLWTLKFADAYFEKSVPLSRTTAEEYLNLHFQFAQAYDGLGRSNEATLRIDQARALLKSPVLKNMDKRQYVHARLMAMHARANAQLGFYAQSSASIEQAQASFAACEPEAFPEIVQQQRALRTTLAMNKIHLRDYEDAERLLDENIEQLHIEYEKAPSENLKELLDAIGVRFHLYTEIHNVLRAADDIETMLRISEDHGLKRDKRMELYLHSLILARQHKAHPATKATIAHRRKYAEEHLHFYGTDHPLHPMIRKLQIK